MNLLLVDSYYQRCHSSRAILIISLDLKQKNILLAIEDDCTLVNYEKAEINEPSPRKIDGDRIIYLSRELDLPRTPGPPILCDFGEARFAGKDSNEEIQPYIYRAPEVILKVPWNEKVDIWNVGVLVSLETPGKYEVQLTYLLQIWDLFQNKHLFDATNGGETTSTLYHLAEMVALLGPPPKELLARGDTASTWFAEDGMNSSAMERDCVLIWSY